MFTDKVFPDRGARPEALRDTIAARNDWDFPHHCLGSTRTSKVETCHAGNQGNHGVLVIGDSHAQIIYEHAVELYAHRAEGYVDFATMSGCPPIPNINRVVQGRKCYHSADQQFALAETGPYDTVIVIAYWPNYYTDDLSDRICLWKNNSCAANLPDNELIDQSIKQLEERLKSVRNSGRRVVVVLPLPTPGTHLPLELAKRAFSGAPTNDLSTISLDTYHAKNDAVRARLIAMGQELGMTILDPVTTMCPDHTCPLLDKSGNSLYKDDNHLRGSAVRERFSFLDTYLLDEK